MDYGNLQIEELQRRVREADIIFLEYLRIEHLLDYAAQSRDLLQYAIDHAPFALFDVDEQAVGRANLLLYADPVTLRLIDANDAALSFLGYGKADLLQLSIPELETTSEETHPLIGTYVENTIKEEIYPAMYRHRTGQQKLVHVSKRLLYKDEQSVWTYRLEDRSLHRRLWHELLRREQGVFTFQKKLQMLTDIAIDLSQLPTLDALCRRIVECALNPLGFDRMGLWLLDREQEQMIGTYGTDETGVVRAEHLQRWSYHETYIAQFLAGKTETVFAYDESPIYNDQSEIIGYGWHMSAPMRHGETLLGVLSFDNLLNKRPVNDHVRELLRLYGLMAGALIDLIRQRGSD